MHVIVGQETYDPIPRASGNATPLAASDTHRSASLVLFC